ncbi:M12 family metallopeptidase [Methyloprofundus sp.]|uniref:M12 family metallopeptidase n=1 Tax=Methyloprofundus sp. TaxID=2020875 RepID=UPI003D0BAC3E
MTAKKKTSQEYAATTEDITLCCSLPEVQDRDLSHITDGHRLRLIASMDKMWTNGTNLTYFFFKGPAHWRGGNEQEQAVRDAFAVWKDLGIGLSFQEVEDAADAILRIGFDPSDGSWSYVGRDSIKFAKDPATRTVNFGWDLTTPYGRDTALHEIGHALGFPHEHQNPKAGIVWDEEKVYEALGGPPNNWPREQTRWNIIRKIPANTVDGSVWDKDSIMHYQFQAGLIKHPVEYQTRSLVPASGLSTHDMQTVTRLYPPIPKRLPELRAYESHRFDIAAGEQINFEINPANSRDYTIQTFGEMDTVMVLFEVREGSQEYLDGDDDSGLDYNAKIIFRLHRGRKYIIRTRLYYAMTQGSGAIMLY